MELTYTSELVAVKYLAVAKSISADMAQWGLQAVVTPTPYQVNGTASWRKSFEHIITVTRSPADMWVLVEMWIT